MKNVTELIDQAREQLEQEMREVANIVARRDEDFVLTTKGAGMQYLHDELAALTEDLQLVAERYERVRDFFRL